MEAHLEPVRFSPAKNNYRKRQIIHLIRRAAGLGPHDYAPVYLEPSISPPRLEGERGGHFTRGGTRIKYPNAYAKVGRSNMVYRRSTLRVVVGGNWLVDAELALRKQ